MCYWRHLRWYFSWKLTLWMWQHLFLLTSGSSCESAEFFDRKCLDLNGTGILNLRIHAECSNHLSYGDHDTNINCHNNYTYVHVHASRYRRLYILNIIHINTMVNISLVFGWWSNMMPFVNVNFRVKSISTMIGQNKNNGKPCACHSCSTPYLTHLPLAEWPPFCRRYFQMIFP